MSNDPGVMEHITFPDLQFLPCVQTMYGVNSSHTHQEPVDCGDGALKSERGIQQEDYRVKIQKEWSTSRNRYQTPTSLNLA